MLFITSKHNLTKVHSIHFFTWWKNVSKHARQVNLCLFIVSKATRLLDQYAKSRAAPLNPPSPQYRWNIILEQF